MKYWFERVSAENFKDFIFIFECTHGRKVDPDLVRKKFDTAYTGISHVGMIAYSEAGEPAAFYGVFPQYAYINGVQVLAAQSGDTITHPDHRRRGLFESLFRETVVLCRQLGVKFIFGFPNSNSYPGFLKFGWLHPFDSTTFSLNNGMPAYAKVLRKINPALFYKWQDSKIQSKSVDISSYQQTYRSEATDKFLLSRDADYLEYKKRLGSSFIKLRSGWAFVKYSTNTVEVGDVLGNDKLAVMKDLLIFLRRIFIQNVFIHTSVLNDLAEGLRSFGFISRKTDALIIYPVDEQLKTDWNLFQYTSLDYDTY